MRKTKRTPQGEVGELGAVALALQNPASARDTHAKLKETPAVRDLLTAGVGSVDKKDTRHKREGKGKIKNRARNANCASRLSTGFTLQNRYLLQHGILTQN